MIRLLTSCFALLVLPTFFGFLTFAVLALRLADPGWSFGGGVAVGLALAFAGNKCKTCFIRRQRQDMPIEAGPALQFLARLSTFFILIAFSGGTAYWFALPAGECPAGWAATAASLFVYLAGLGILVTSDPHQRGRRLLTFPEAKQAARRLLRKGDPGLPWGGVLLPSTSAAVHFAVAGATGSGKTLTLRLLMQAVLPRIGQPEAGDCRALVYDAKQDILSILHGLGVSCPIKLLHPLDKRGVAWDIGADCTDPATAQQVAAILIPTEEGPNRFFAEAARHLLTGVIITFMRSSASRWDLRDLVLAMKSKRRLRRILGRDEQTRDLLEYLEEERTSLNILSTASARMSSFEPIAAAWSHATERVSLRSWVEGRFILVLGNDEAVRSALDAINQVIFKRASELLLAQSESDTRRTWLFLDEIRMAGKLDGLNSLLTKGRSKGTCVVLGFQDIGGLREVYGERVADELVGQCGQKAFLRLESRGCSDWASQVIGDSERLEYSQSWTSSKDGGSSSTNEQLVKREAVLPSQIMTLDPTNPDNGLSGFYLAPGVGAYSSLLKGKVLARQLRPRDLSVANFVPRPGDQQYLQPWTADDLERLGLGKDEEPSGNTGKTVTPVPSKARLKVVQGKGTESE